jgi:hypothetical protein
MYLEMASALHGPALDAMSSKTLISLLLPIQFEPQENTGIMLAAY